MINSLEAGSQLRIEIEHAVSEASFDEGSQERSLHEDQWKKVKYQYRHFHCKTVSLERISECHRKKFWFNNKYDLFMLSSTICKTMLISAKLYLYYSVCVDCCYIIFTF